MDALTYRLDQFEGPLDLLLTLIQKNKVSITDIPISLICDQYMEYINDMSEQNMEIAGEFLEMAAHLVYIKTVSLLPKHEEAEVMKKELQGRLIEYSLCKRAAELMQERYIGNVVTVRKPMKIEFDSTYAVIHDPDVLKSAYLGINVKKTEEPVKQESFNTIVKKKIVSVTSRIIYVLRRLYRTGECMTEGLFEGITDRSERVAIFLALLELTKSGRILFNEDNTQITFNRNYSRRDSEDQGEEAAPSYN